MKFRTLIGLALLSLAVSVSVYVGIAYVVVHFVKKFW